MQAIASFISARVREVGDPLNTMAPWYEIDSARGPGWGHRDCLLDDSCYLFDGNEETTAEGYWQHLEGHHNRVRVLGLCTSLLAILAPHEPTTVQHMGEDGWGTHCQTCGVVAPCPTLRTIAATWTGHTDYDISWRPA